MTCIWPKLDSHQKSCEVCMGHKSLCIIDWVQVSKQKWREPKERSGLRQDKMWVEVEAEIESDGSGEDG